MPKARQKKRTDEVTWTIADTAQAVRFTDLPKALQTTIAGRSRGAQKTPVKRAISIRISPDVLEAMRATGNGWQTTAEQVLRSHFLKPAKEDSAMPPQ